jgi:hypothetical protein
MTCFIWNGSNRRLSSLQEKAHNDPAPFEADAGGDSRVA